MNREKWVILIATLGLIGATGGLLGQLHGRQQLAPPGVRTHPLPESNRLEVDLPELVLDYTSEKKEPDDATLGNLPKDTSFGLRRYKAPDGFGILLNVVLMGTDRTSLHKPQFCLEGLGWRIDQGEARELLVKMERPCAYELPVVELVSSKQFREQRRRSVYVYWYVADDAVSGDQLGVGRMWLMAKKLLRTGVLQRWAYVSCFSDCAPGQEDQTLARIKSFIQSAAPEFQLFPRPAQASSSLAAGQ